MEMMEQTSNRSAAATAQAPSASSMAQAFFPHKTTTTKTSTTTSKSGHVPGAAQHAIVYSQTAPHVTSSSTLSSSSSATAATTPLSPRSSHFSLSHHHRDVAASPESYLYLFGEPSHPSHIARATAAAETGATSSGSHSSSSSTTTTATTLSDGLTGPPLSPVGDAKLSDRFSPFLVTHLDDQPGNFDDVYTWLHEPMGLDKRTVGGPKMDFDDADLRLDFDTINDDNTDHLTGFMLETLEVS